MLHLADNKGKFHLHSDTNEFAARRGLYQILNGKPELIAYGSKRLPKAARKYSITELEMCGLPINIASFVHLLKRVDFWCYSRSFSFDTYILTDYCQNKKIVGKFLFI